MTDMRRAAGSRTSNGNLANQPASSSGLAPSALGATFQRPGSTMSHGSMSASQRSHGNPQQTPQPLTDEHLSNMICYTAVRAGYDPNKLSDLQRQAIRDSLITDVSFPSSFFFAKQGCSLSALALLALPPHFGSVRPLTPRPSP
jgi:hypothetical protein